MTLQSMQLSNCQIPEGTSLRGHVGALSSTSSLSLSRVCALLFQKHVTQRPCGGLHTPSCSLAQRNPLLHSPLVTNSSGVDCRASLCLSPERPQSTDAGTAPTAVCAPHSARHASQPPTLIGSARALQRTAHLF